MKAEEIKTLKELAEYINECEDWPRAEFYEIITRNGWVDDSGETYGVCHNDHERIIINDSGLAEVIYA